MSVRSIYPTPRSADTAAVVLGCALWALIIAAGGAIGTGIAWALIERRQRR